MNWGKGIALLYISFVAFMVFMVYQSSRHDLNLVTKDYYEKDLQFEDHRKKMVNSTALEQDVEIKHVPEAELLTFKFPQVGYKIEGTIYFFRPSDGTQDRSVNIEPGQSNTMDVPTGKLASGHWRVQVDWTDGKKAYFTETTLVL